MSERKTTTVGVFDQERYDGDDWMPTNLVEAVEWLQEIVDGIPVEYRSAAKIEIGAIYRYEDAEAIIKISYERPETDEEMAIRLRQEKADADYRCRRDLETLAALKAKYGQ